MNAKSLIAAVCGTILKVAFAVLIIMMIYRGAILAYDYGYRVFEEPAMSAGEGRAIVVTIPEDMSPKEMGQLFLSKGLIRDDRLFVLQYYFSEFRKDLKAGDFELSTAMKVEEMMEAMTREPVVEPVEPAGMDDLPQDIINQGTDPNAAPDAAPDSDPDGEENPEGAE